MPHTCDLLDETNGIHCRTTSSSTQEWCLLKGLGRRLAAPEIDKFQSLFYIFVSHSIVATGARQRFFSVTMGLKGDYLCGFVLNYFL